MPRPARVTVPPGLEWWRRVPGGTRWLEGLPAVVMRCAERWDLELEPPFPDAHISYVAPGRLRDGTAVVLKVNFPEPETEHEPDALAHWDGEGAAILYAHAERGRALLMERCEPGSRLWELEDEHEANAIAVELLRKLWRPAPPEHSFRLLAYQAERWAEELSRDWKALGGPFERPLLEEAVAACRELARDQGEAVVLHQDFHGGNVLRAAREPWLVIDPKPLVGEREFDAASLLRDRRWELVSDPHPRARIRRRLDQLSEELDLDRERMRRWGIAHALAWGVSGQKLEDDMVSCARWLAAAR
jgi:streptomycin 6-kinase